MQVVVISTCRPEAMPTVRAIVERWPTTVVLRPTEAPRGRGAAWLRREVRHPVLAGRRAYFRVQRLRLSRSVRRLLGSGHGGRVERTAVAAASLNGGGGLDTVTSLAPDVLVLFGCPILRQPLLDVPRLGTVNVHLGIAPDYRGEHTIFHALRRRDHDHIGATLHHVDHGVDSGAVVAQVYPALDAGDDEATLLAKTAMLMPAVAVDYLTVVERTGAMPGKPQTGTGRQYRRSERLVRHELSEWMGRRLLARRPPTRPERIVRFYDPRGLELTA